jgi:hypothetical protein
MLTAIFAAIVYISFRYTAHNLDRKMNSQALAWLTIVVAIVFFWFKIKDNTQADEYLLAVIEAWAR